LDSAVVSDKEDMREHFLENHLICFSEITPFVKPPKQKKAPPETADVPSSA
jgi:hypothetical protein